MHARWFSALLIAFISGALLTGCNGSGIDVKVPDLTDSPPPNGGGGDNGDGNGGTPGSPRFVGTFITSYTDDFTSAAASSPSDYTARITLEQTGSEISGSGEMARFFRTGSFNNAQFEFNLSGSAAAGSNDGLITFRNRPNRNDFDRIPVWTMRRAGDRLVGIYGEFNNNNQLVRSGHAVFRREQTASVNGTWVSTGADSFAAESLTRLDRTARIALDNPSGNTVEGSGGFVEQPLDQVVQARNVTVTEGARQGQRVGLRLGGPEFGENEFQHLGFFSDSVMHTAYGEFRLRQTLRRMGQVTWYRGRTPDAASINGNWVASFSDSRTQGGGIPRSYVTLLQLEVQEGNRIAGTAYVLDESDTTEISFRRADIVEGAIVGGTRLQLTLSQTGASFEWDLRMAQAQMVGTYRRFNPQGDPTSVGNAVFYRTGTPALEGTWTAAFVDRINEVRAPETQLAIVQITAQTGEGGLSGTGRLTYAAEIDDLERVFNVTGSVSQTHPSGPWIQWTWSGSDLAGDTVWNLRQQNNVMVGSYTNYTANGALESRGHAVWYR
jgi:hypothetical protein